jgi:hypothetical protein
MENKTRYHHFTFVPTQLRDSRKQIEKKYKESDQHDAERVSSFRLPRLLELIRKTPLEEINTLAQTFKKIDVMVLLYQYPYPDESNETRRKVNQVLFARYSTAVGQFAWNLFQHDWEEVFLQDLLRRIYAVDGYAFMSVDWDDSTRAEIESALSSQSGISIGLVPLFSDGKWKTTELLNILKVKKESPLEEELMYQTLLNGLDKEHLVRRDGVEFIRQKLERYPMNQYKDLVKIYLDSRTHEEFEPLLIQQAVDRLYDPRERMADWEFLSERTLDEVKRWLIVNELKKFFEKDTNKRFDYWKIYLPYIDNVLQLKDKNDPKVVFIYFKKFVVVEFGNIGAAYFYHKEGFDKWILSRTKERVFRGRSTSTKESLLKDTAREKGGTPLYINKLGHHGYFDSWTKKFTRYMREYFDGYFDYSEG